MSRMITAQMVWYFDLDNMPGLDATTMMELESTNELTVTAQLDIIGKCRQIVMGDLTEVVDQQRYEDIDVVLDNV